MQHYEMMYIIPMSYTINEVPTIKSSVKKILEENGAQIDKEESLGKQKFAYPIKKLSHGYYEIIEFNMPPLNLIEVDKVLKISDDVVRYLIVKKKIKSETELAAEQKLREKIAEQDKNRKSIFDEEEDVEMVKPKKTRVARTQEVKKKEEEAGKVDISDIDEKLDAILEGEDMLQ